MHREHAESKNKSFLLYLNEVLMSFSWRLYSQYDIGIHTQEKVEYYIVLKYWGSYSNTLL